MVNLVRIALTRAYTFVVMTVMIVPGGTLAALRTPADICPNIPVPVVAVAWSFTGLSPEDNDIEHMEAQALPFLGCNVYPEVDSGSIVMHVRAPSGHPGRGDLRPLRAGCVEVESPKALNPANRQS